MTDPPGLDAAIEAAYGASYHGGPFEPPREDLATAVRAAAPALRAGALREAADALPRSAHVPGSSVVVGTEAIRMWLRERADRIGGAT